MKVDSYLLTEPYVIKKVSSELIRPCKDNGEILVWPVMVGICGSDILYFKGHKDLTKLQQRLPLVPLHEGIVRLEGSRGLGCVVPFRECGRCCACLNGMENLCEKSAYMGSTAPGLGRSAFIYPRDLIVDIPEKITPRTAVLVEPISIVYRMLMDTSIRKGEKVAVIGTGLMARLTVVLLSVLKGIDRQNLFLIGRTDAKLEKFNDLCNTANFAVERDLISRWSNSFSVAIEAIGGHFMTQSLTMAAGLVKPGAGINIFGLSDDMCHLNFSLIVNKGLTLSCFSRARRRDYTSVMKLLEDCNGFVKLIERAIDPSDFVIRNENDLMDAYHYAMSGNNDGRVIISFQE